MPNSLRFRRAFASLSLEIAALTAFTSPLIITATACEGTVVTYDGPKGTGGDACSEARCEEPPSVCCQKTGTCSNGSCSYAYADGAGCDDGDACTSGDNCASGACGGTPLACNTPPESTCVSATTLRTYDAVGACGAGACSYLFADATCPSGCDGGRCNGDPCAGVQCDQPPSVCYQQTGTCSNGSCSYAYADGTGCDDGDACTSDDHCASGACRGAPLACTTPTVPTCVSANTLRTYDAIGVCAEGACSYAYADTECVLSCSAGVCNAATTPAISAGAAHACGVLPGGAVKCWGWNASGQLGNGSTTESHVPVDVPGLSSGIVAISARGFHTCALTSTGATMCWGDNLFGQLGNNSTAETHVPVDVTGLSDVISIAAGVDHTCALTSLGAVKCWGRNDYGQLGNNSAAHSSVPVDVNGLSAGAVAISAGLNYSCALTSLGTVKCWGVNDWGQLGNSTRTDSPIPVDVTGLSSSVMAISLGDRHACAVSSTGALKCWGDNGFGELGNNSTMYSTVPVDVTGLSSSIVSVSAGGYFTCAHSSAGGLTCWGENFYGSLGNDSRTDSSVPVDVTGLSSGVVAVSAGLLYACALTSGGVPKCWGRNVYGALGNSSTTDSSVPVDVVGF